MSNIIAVALFTLAVVIIIYPPFRQSIQNFLEYLFEKKTYAGFRKKTTPKVDVVQKSETQVDAPPQEIVDIPVKKELSFVQRLIAGLKRNPSKKIGEPDNSKKEVDKTIEALKSLNIDMTKKNTTADYSQKELDSITQAIKVVVKENENLETAPMVHFEGVDAINPKSSSWRCETLKFHFILSLKKNEDEIDEWRWQRITKVKQKNSTPSKRLI